MRGAVAQHHGLDESLAAMAAAGAPRDRSQLSPAQQSALRLADLLMTQPGEIDETLTAELRQHFTQDQIIELTLDVMKWNYQKVAVALRVDVEVKPGELTALVFDEQGHWVRPRS